MSLSEILDSDSQIHQIHMDLGNQVGVCRSYLSNTAGFWEASSGNLATARTAGLSPSTLLKCPTPSVSSRSKALPSAILRLSPLLASKCISPWRTNIHIRMGEGCISPTQLTGKCKKPHCVAGSSAETLNGEAGGAKSCKVTGMVTESKLEPPFDSAMSRGNVKSLGIGTPFHLYEGLALSANGLQGNRQIDLYQIEAP